MTKKKPLARRGRTGHTKVLQSSASTGAPPADPTAWTLKIVIEEDEELSARRFTVWLAPAGDSGTHLCIGSGPTRAAATMDAEVELRGALGLLEKQIEWPACEKCGYRIGTR